MEKLFVYDRTGNPTGIIKPLSEIKQKGLFHKAIAVWIIDEFGNILLQQRCIHKRVYSGLWSALLKGHQRYDETAIEACIRELKEELGLLVSPDELLYLYTIQEEDSSNQTYQNNLFFDTYLLKIDSCRDLTLDPLEVAAIKWLSWEEFQEDLKIKKQDYINNAKDYELFQEYYASITN